MPETIAPATSGRAGPDEPQERECLRCYLGRMLIRYGCDNTRRWTVRWRDSRAPGDEALLDELADHGGICCDCEVVTNVWEADHSVDEQETKPGPACRGTVSQDPLDLCALWDGWSLRYPADEEEDMYYEDDAEELDDEGGDYDE